MAHFEMPSDANSRNYDLNHGSATPNDVWRMRIPERRRGEIVLWGGNGLTVVSNNPNVIPNEPYLTRRKIEKPHSEIISLYGLNGGTSLIFAGQGQFQTNSWRKWCTLQVTVGDKPDKQIYKIKTDAPNMAFNSHDTPVKYQFSKTEHGLIGMSANEIITKIKKHANDVKFIKHLAFSAHTNREKTVIEIGKGIHLKPGKTIDLFSRLKGNIGVIWFGSCAAAGTDDGKALFKKLSKEVGCYIVAAGMNLENPPGFRLGINEIEVNIRCMPVVFTPPAGEMIIYKKFFALGNKLGFRLIE